MQSKRHPGLARVCLAVAVTFAAACASPVGTGDGSADVTGDRRDGGGTGDSSLMDQVSPGDGTTGDTGPLGDGSSGGDADASIDAPTDGTLSDARGDAVDGCTPTGPEVCDGVDNDCNGMVDDGIPNLTCGMGECRRIRVACVGGVPQTCTPGTPSMEVCDGLDNDCNGMVDDGLGTTMCGMGACQRTVNNCDMGASVTCMPGRPSPETCNGRDDDCNGMVDDGLGTSTCGMGACQRTVNNCDMGTTRTCTPGTPSMEICNGVDDNCDGTVDEGLGVSTCGVGACRRMQANCVGGVMVACVAGAPGMEICNGIDDDCNGMVDDGLGVLTCGTGACMRTVPACVGGMAQTCLPGPMSPEVCDGIDNNCDGMIDEGNPGGGGVCPSGFPGVCATGTLTCGGGHLSCVPNVMPGTRTEVCNGLDDNCDGLTDEGAVTTLCPPGPGVAVTTCGGASGCQITMCAAGRYNADGDPSNGCECLDDTNGAVCGSATNLGAISAGGSISSVVSKVPAAMGEDWFVVTFPINADVRLHGTGTPRITFSVNDGSAFRFELRDACTSGPLGCATGSASATGLTDWTFTDNQAIAGATQWSSRNTSWPSTVYIRVYRTTPGQSCANYQLSITR